MLIAVCIETCFNGTAISITDRNYCIVVNLMSGLHGNENDMVLVMKNVRQKCNNKTLNEVTNIIRSCAGHRPAL